MSVADYQGRKYDVLAFRGQPQLVMAPVNSTLFDSLSSGEICAGVQKLAQRWLLEFLTATGSMPYLPTRGCSFISRLRSGQIQTTLDLETDFNFATVDIANNLRAEEDDTMPDDERYKSATLLAATLLGDEASLTIQLTSLAGDTRKLILPLSTLPQ